MNGKRWRMPYLPLLVALIVLMNASAARRNAPKSDITIKYFGACQRLTTPNKIVNASVSNFGKGVTKVNFAYLSKEELREGKIRFNVYRCLTECERYIGFSTDICKLFEEKGMPWSNFVSSCQPRMKCPLRKDTIYRYINATLEAAEVTRAGMFAMPSSMEQGTWKTEIIVFDQNNKVLTCGESQIVFTKARNKKY